MPDPIACTFAENTGLVNGQDNPLCHTPFKLRSVIHIANTASGKRPTHEINTAKSAIVGWGKGAYKPEDQQKSQNIRDKECDENDQPDTTMFLIGIEWSRLTGVEWS
ncbi:MAG: hypothetical protein R3C44_16070 [Chloroflexota bacterium]